MNSRNMLNHSQVGQGIGISGRTNSMGSSGLGSPNRSSPSIICMPKQQPARQPFTINRYIVVICVLYSFSFQGNFMLTVLFFQFSLYSMSGFGMNRNQAFGMNNSLSSNIFNGTG